MINKKLSRPKIMSDAFSRNMSVTFRKATNANINKNTISHYKCNKCQTKFSDSTRNEDKECPQCGSVHDVETLD